jgi:hypothetical protein
LLDAFAYSRKAPTRFVMSVRPYKYLSACISWNPTGRTFVKFGIGEFHYDLYRTSKLGYIHYAVCLATGPKLLPQRFLHIGRSRTSSFNFQYLTVSLTPSSSYLRLLPRLPVPYTFSSITCFIRQFLRKMWPSSYPSFVSPYVAWSFPPWLYVIFLHFSPDWPNWPPLISSTTFQNFSCFSDLLSEVSNFQHYKTLRSKGIALLVSLLNLSSVCW